MDNLKNDLTIEVYQQDWIPAFAAFADDYSIQENAKAHVVINLGSILSTVKAGDIDKKEVPYFIAECIMHEVIHALESWADVEFNEERVEALINKYNEWAEKNK